MYIIAIYLSFLLLPTLIRTLTRTHTYANTHTHTHTHTPVSMLVSHQAPPQVADRGTLVRYDGYRGNKIPGADQN